MAGIDSYTVSCLHFQNRVWTFAGTAQIDTAQHPFSSGGSLLLDGDSDYISTPDSVDFAFGTGDFTIDFWVRFAALPAAGDYSFVVSQRADADNLIQLTLYNNSGTYSWNYSSNVASVQKAAISRDTTVLVNTWYHVALSRNGNNFRWFQDGVPLGVAEVDADESPNIAAVLEIGRWGGDGYYFNGHIGEFRITKGLARWTADFSGALPSAKYADDANTVSLLHFDEADASTFTKDVAANWAMDAQAQFYDESGKVWTAAGDAQLDTAQYKWTASGLFDGTEDYISTPDHADFDFGSGDFTIDFWVRRDGNINDYGGVIAGTSNSDNGWNMSFGSVAGSNQNKMRFNHPSGSWGAKIVSDTVLPDTTWTHIALVRYGNTITMYQAGTSVGSVDCTGWTVDCSGTGVVIGRYYTNVDSDYFNGWIEEFRISKGIARWTANFTPPTVEYSTITIYSVPALTDTDTVVAPSINHVFPGYFVDTDTFLIPSINHVFPIPATDTDAMVAPKYNMVLKMPVYITDADTLAAPGFGRLISFTGANVDTDTLFAPRIEGIPVPRHRVKVNY